MRVTSGVASYAVIMVYLRWFAVVLVAVVTVACGEPDAGPDGTPDATVAASSPTATAGASATVTGTATEAATASATATATVPTTVTATATTTAVTTATAAPTVTTATPAPASLGIRATRLQIPSQNLDAEVVLSYTTPDTGAPYPGCAAPPPGGQTLTVPNFGIATPQQAFAGLEHVAWIFGHSRWQGAPGLLMVLQYLGHGDVLLVDGIDRATGDAVERRRYVVEGIYLADRDSGGD